MALKDLSKKLYKKKDELKKRELDKDVYDARQMDQAKDGFEKVEGNIIKTQGRRDFTEEQEKVQKNKMVVFGGILLIILLAIFSVVFLYFKVVGSAFLEEKVEISITGPTEVRSAEDAVYVVRVENFNRVALQNVRIELNYSPTMVIQEKPYIQQEGFKASRIVSGNMKAKEKKEYEVIFKPFGPRDRQVFINATVRYQPANFNSEFEKLTQTSVVIKSSPLSITLIPVKKAASGEKVHLDAIIKNNSPLEFENLEFGIDYPEGFIFEKSSIAPSKDKNVWKIDKIGNKEQIKIGIDGIIEGVPDSLKSFKAEIGERRGENDMLVFTENEAVMKVIASRVSLIQKVASENLYPGDSVIYNIEFKNTSEVPLRDLILMQYIDSRLINEGGVAVKNGHYDSNTDVVLWKASQVPELKLLMPGESGMVTVVAPIITKIPMDNENDKNFTINSYAEIESLDVDSPLWQNKRIRSLNKEIKINSKLLVDVEGIYDSNIIPNKGPTPLVVGDETTFTISLDVMNTSNDLKNAILTMKFPANIHWKNQFQPYDTRMEFNERTNELRMVIGTIPAGTGFIDPVKTYAFQIGMIPSEHQVGVGRIALLTDFRMTAVDTFTENEVEYKFKEFNLQNISDVETSIISEAEAEAESLAKESEEVE